MTQACTRCGDTFEALLRKPWCEPCFAYLEQCLEACLERGKEPHEQPDHRIDD